MEKSFFIVSIIFPLFILLMMAYHFAIGVVGAYKLSKDKDKKTEPKNPEKSFALIVSAHNEEVVIGGLVESFNHLNYPKELYDVFVIADNCTDSTADVARKHGANVYERFNKEKRGKGFALEWMFKKIFDMDKHYDAIGIFDADNLVDSEFLQKMNSKMCEGYEVVQCYIETKNPKDSWVTESCDLSLGSTVRRLQYGRDSMGLSAQLGGTGFILTTEILKEMGWGATCLTEDLEFTCKLILNGKRVGVADDAIIYDEKPLTLNDSWKQRKRWMQGFADVASRYTLKLLKKAIVDRDKIAFDCAMYVLQPFMTSLLAIAIGFTILSSLFVDPLRNFFSNYIFYDGLWGVICLVEIAFMAMMMMKDKVKIGRTITMMGAFLIAAFIQPFFVVNLSILDDKVMLTIFNIIYAAIFFVISVKCLGEDVKDEVLRYLGSAVYVLTWVPITMQGIANKDNKEWSHTKHVRQLGIYEM
ncbi:MAG: glycosyltransferase family 2 protein [Sarcina sp.]